MFHRAGGHLAMIGLALMGAATAAASVHQGKVVSVDTDELAIVIIDAKGKERSFRVDEACKVTLDGDEADLKDIEKGAKVKLTTAKRKGAEVAVKIEAKSPK
ncbi:MAG TPA: hypothetical protein VGX78_16315 [Pirellulales bacterium]|jgi:hypothetical protein|nr:hypothetical protein [Pirellulales bacterium]